jgi:hypothetical protein
MQSITFALPTLPTGSMSKTDQIDVLLNQATAAVVCCYLEHMNKAIEKGVSQASHPSTAPSNFITQSVINDVQSALKSV